MQKYKLGKSSSGRSGPYPCDDVVRESAAGLHLGSVSQVEKFLSGFQVSGGPDGGNAFGFCEIFVVLATFQFSLMAGFTAVRPECWLFGAALIG